MHAHTIRTKYTFGDRVRFDSTFQRRSGIGTVYAICFSGDGIIDYLIAVDGEDGHIQGGIDEHDMTPLTDSSDPPHVVN